MKNFEGRFLARLLLYQFKSIFTNLNRKFGMKQIINRQSGFTLIEMLVAMTVIGIVLAIAAPNFSQWIERYRIDAEAQDVYFDLMSARATAVKNNNDVIVTFDSANNSYKVHDDTNGDGMEAGESVKTVSLDDTVAFGINGSPADIDGNTITSPIFS